MIPRKSSSGSIPAAEPGLSRRAFIVGAGAAGGFSLGFSVPGLAQDAQKIGPLVAAADAEVNAWVVIKPDDTCVVRIVRTEMGQGTITGLAQLVAEELECDWKKVTYEYPTPGESHARKRVWGEFGTGGSRGIRTSHDYVRRGGAVARMMLMEAAAQELKVPVTELTVADGIVTHTATKRTVSYGKVAAAASKLTPPDPKTVALKDPKDWKIAGKPLRRLDTAAKLDGSKKFAVDLTLPGMLNAAIKAAPVHGSKVTSYDEAKVLGMPGVKKVVKVDDQTVAVVADTWWHAKKALDALPVVYETSPNDKVSSATIATLLKDALEPGAPNVLSGLANGDVAAGLAAAAKKIEAVYSTPFLAHATMEPMTCVAKVTADRAEIWVPTQNGEASHAALSKASGLPLDKCEVYKQDPGGGFGRRGGAQDYVHQATAIAKAMPGIPVKMIWSREEDMAHDFYRPISMCKMSAGLDEQGNLTTLHMRVSGQSINAWVNPAAIKEGKVDDRQLQGLVATAPDSMFGYTAIPNLNIEYAMRNTHVPVGPWRGVNTNQNGVYGECFIEEVAKLAGKDSLEFRRALLTKSPKHLAVLNAAAEKGDWGKPLPAGVHRGIAQFMGYGSYSAATAEVSVSAKGVLKVHRLVLALDCGYAVNPDQIAAQVEGSVAYGLSATLFGECTVKDGKMVERNFDTYEILRLADMPKVETVIANSGGFWGGVGEPTICVVAPAVLNAIFAATGKPVRSLPLKNVKLV
jgi:isoquinoline 1-oxidoreductase subunit beta